VDNPTLCMESVRRRASDTDVMHKVGLNTDVMHKVGLNTDVVHKVGLEGGGAPGNLGAEGWGRGV